MKLLGLGLLFISLNGFAMQTRSFSCGGTYENKDGYPYSSIHAQGDYNELSNGTKLVLEGEDSRFVLKGSLEIKSDMEYLNIELLSKHTGLTLYNNNSQLGQPGKNGFNFVFLGMKNVGDVETSNGVKLNAIKASFQCQTYQN